MKRLGLHTFFWSLQWLSGLLGSIWLTGCVTPKQLAYFQGTGTTSALAMDSLYNVAADAPLTKGLILTIRANSTSPPGRQPANPFEPILIPGRPIDPPSITGYLIDKRGNLSLPLIGVISAAGKSSRQLADTIQAKLVAAHLQNPTVLVQFTTRISVLGEVNRPGVFTLNNTFVTLPEALGLAGDLTTYARRNNILVIRYPGNGQLISQEMDLTKRSILSSPFYLLHPGDVVYVSPNKARAASVDRTYQIIPIVLSSLTVIATLTALILSRR